MVVASDHQSGAQSRGRSQTATRSWGGRGSTDQGRLWELQSEKNTCIAASALEKRDIRGGRGRKRMASKALRLGNHDGERAGSPPHSGGEPTWTGRESEKESQEQADKQSSIWKADRVQELC